jgi:hypothetical protein
MALWIRDFQAGAPPASLINQPRFDAALELVRAGYEDLISLRDQQSPNTHVFFHSYDFAIPDGRGVCFLGPWLKPTFDLRGFPTQSAGFAVVKEMLQQFLQMQTQLQGQNITVIPTQGTLEPVVGSWGGTMNCIPARRASIRSLSNSSRKSRRCSQHGSCKSTACVARSKRFVAPYLIDDLSRYFERNTPCSGEWRRWRRCGDRGEQPHV